MGVTRSYQYGMQDQTLSQVETRMAEGSHLHLDDVRYEVSLLGGTRPAGTRPGQDDASTVAREPGAGEAAPSEAAASEASFGFTVRNGLAVRLPDSLTTPPAPAASRPV